MVGYMTEKERKQRAKEFAEYWKDKGYEKGESQKFWLTFLRDVLGVEKPEQLITFEETVKSEHTKFVDGWIDSTKVLIEQKSATVDLRRPIRQADGSLLTTFQQALKYNNARPYSKKARWIITCNFVEFLIYDMEKPNGEPDSILLKDLYKECYRMQFIAEQKSEYLHKEEQISLKAGEIVGVLYKALLKQYDDKNAEELKSLNELCVRIIFCLYAEDSGLFGERLAFHNYIKGYSAKDLRRALIELFKVLDTKIEDRDKYLGDDLAKFPYVNGGLFSNENIIIPQLTEEIQNILLSEASENFDWSEISPTIFGAVFESTLNPETRRGGGMHYTSIENIHKVIDPLFLNELKEELATIKEIKVEKTRKQRLVEFQNKLASLNFLDPACGSGNFLTETYISIRRLENEVIGLQIGHEKITFFDDMIKVSIGQFYGIEINDFAVTVAKTALWIAESQMMKETEQIVHMPLEFFPLKSYANIIEGNALSIDWESVCPQEKLSYIMGNPPFVGGMLMSAEQKNDIFSVLGEVKGVGELDYVSAWYYKATQLIKNSKIQVAFVSTNSICQGQQAVTMWKPLFEKGIKIRFAHRTFIWNSEAKAKAHVHCVIVGFSMLDIHPKFIFDNDMVWQVKNINSYLTNAPIVFIESRSTPICDVPHMRFGSMPRGDFFYTTEEKEQILAEYPIAEKWIKKFIGADEFIKGKDRWCLWLVGADPKELRSCKNIMEKIDNVRQERANSKASATRKFANTPTLFCQIAQPNTGYLVVPCHSTERRKYIPIGFMDSDVICGNANQLIPNATLYHFGILTSNVHNAWMRAVSGRIKSDYRYSKDIVYNAFPWCNPTKEQKARIEETAQAILNARALYPDCSLADLYDEKVMPKELRDAHRENDKAVMQAYGFWGKIKRETECVAELMKMYQKMAKEK